MNNLWNTFLDTTPREWGQAAERRIQSTFARIFTFRKLSVGSIAGLLSMTAHAGVFAIVAYGIHNPATPAGEAGESYQVEFQTMEPVKVASEPVFDENSDIVMRAPKQKPKTDAELLAEKLLKRYQGVHIAGSVAHKAAGPEKEKSVFSPRAVPTAREDLGESLMHAPEQKPKVKQEGLSKELSQHLARYQTQFQGCYERALLMDESLNGRIQFALKAGSQGQISESQVAFQGVGRAGIREQLEGCLQTVVRNIHFPGTFAQSFGRTIKFQAVLSL